MQELRMLLFLLFLGVPIAIVYLLELTSSSPSQSDGPDSGQSADSDR